MNARFIFVQSICAKLLVLSGRGYSAGCQQALTMSRLSWCLGCIWNIYELSADNFETNQTANVAGKYKGMQKETGSSGVQSVKKVFIYNLQITSFIYK